MIISANNQKRSVPEIKISDFKYPTSFKETLDYSSPARGKWNIVQTAFLIPESHQIYICAQGCLRGVVLTAAEMNCMDRLSWISVCENDFFDGGLEDDVISGADDIISNMDKKPKAVVLVYSCMHLFAGSDIEMITDSMNKKFPDIKFITGYMQPVRRKSLSPDELMRCQIYSCLEKTGCDENSVNIIGSNFKTDDDSELKISLKNAGINIRDITEAKTYGEFLEMGNSRLNILYDKAAIPAAKQLKKRLGTDFVYIPRTYDFEKTEENYKLLFSKLNLPLPDFSEYKERAAKSVINAKKILGSVPIEIDALSTTAPVSLALFLCENYFNVTKIYLDAVSSDEEKAFDKLKKISPEISVSPLHDPAMRFMNTISAESKKNKILAFGQQAAYFADTGYFVNTVEGEGRYGFSEIEKTMNLLTDAFLNEKDMLKTVSIKGLECDSCLC